MIALNASLLQIHTPCRPAHRPPEKIREIVGLRNKKCVPCEGGVTPLEESQVNQLRMQVRGPWAVCGCVHVRMRAWC